MYIMKKPIAFILIVSLALNIHSQNNSEDKKRLPIIDMHMHTGLPHEMPVGTRSFCRPAPCIGDSKSVSSQDLKEKTFKAIENYNIVKAFLSGVDLSAVQEWSQAKSDLFIASPFILEPTNSNLEELKQLYSEGKLKGMGEIGVQLNGIPPNDRRLEPYFELAEELDLPLLIHLGIGPYTPNFRSAAGSPLLLEEVLIDHPKLRIFVENAGFPNGDQMIAMMYQYPQLYADLSTITWVIPRSAFYDYLKRLLNTGLGKRLMFGSDQMVWPEKIGEAIRAIEEAPFLTYEEKRDILYNNAAGFLRLENVN